MFTEINDKYYLNEQAMTVLMADAVSAYVKPQEQDGLEQLASPAIAAMDSEGIVEAFKKDWRRPRDGSNGDLQDMYKSVPEALQWAAERELDRRADAVEADKHRKLLDAIFNPELDDVELYDYDDEDLF